MLRTGAAARQGESHMDLDPYLRLMVEKSGSDLFFSVGARPSVNIEGKMLPIGEQVVDPDAMHGLSSALLDPRYRAEFETDLEVNLGFSRPGIGRFRASVYHQRGEPAIVIRHIKSQVPTLDELALPAELAEFVMAKTGLVLVVGAAGSGKSTTLAAMVDHRNRNSGGHIVTVEDPIEFLHRHRRSIVDQREVGIDTLSYSVALANALREAPDLIMIGEIRDVEAMGHALHFTETGHLVLATLHANNAAQTIERIVNFFPPDRRDGLLMDLSLHLRAIISQRLIPSLDGRRVAAVEVMPRTAHIADLVLKGRITDIRDAMASGLDPGLRSFDQAIFDLWQAGRIDPQQALHHADSAHELRMRIEFAAPGTFNKINPDDLRISEE